jgi:ribose transport system ATP-binding protein
MSPRPRVARPRLHYRGWVPLALVTVLMILIGAYAAWRTSAFTSEYNLNSLLIESLPLAFIALGQVSALLVGGFDISVGALVTLCVVVASFTMTGSLATWVLVFGALALVGIGLCVGLVNATLVRVVKLPSIIATLATLSVLQGIALRLRPTPGGEISLDVQDALLSGVSFVPYAFIGVVVLAIVWDVWLYRTAGGLTTRAVGLDEVSSRRLGAHSGYVHWRAYVLASLLATVGAFFFAAQVGVGDGKPSTGSSFTLQSIAAAVLGGAALAGGRGSYIGAVIGSIFLSLIINVITLLGWNSAYEQISIGALTLFALVIYQGADLVARARAAWQDVRRRLRPAAAGA